MSHKKKVKNEVLKNISEEIMAKKFQVRKRHKPTKSKS